MVNENATKPVSSRQAGACQESHGPYEMGERKIKQRPLDF